jgi:hypothetical protein
VVWASQIIAIGWYVETSNGSRYLVSSIEKSSSLPITTASVEAAMKK